MAAPEAASAFAAVMLAAAVLSVLLWHLRRQDVQFAWYALHAAAWSVLCGVPAFVPPAWWAELAQSAARYSVFPALMGFFAGGQAKPVLRAAFAVSVLLVLIDQVTAAALELYAVYFALAVFFALRLSEAAKPKALPGGIAAAACFLSAAGLLLGALNRSGLHGAVPGLAAPAAGLLAVLVLAAIPGQRFLAALSVQDDLAVLLENHSRAAGASLAASEAARRALEVSGAITRERARLMQEIHDGIGSSLMMAIASSERETGGEQSSTVLRRVLTDLRIAVDSLEPVEGDVATLLASLRYRVEPDLRRAGIAFDWRVTEVPEIGWLDAANALHVLRICQEAVGNIAAHAGARHITVTTAVETRDGRGGVVLSIRDDGRGFGTLSSQGRGLKNMERRATAIGGALSLASAPGEGTTVSLWLPLER